VSVPKAIFLIKSFFLALLFRGRDKPLPDLIKCEVLMLFFVTRKHVHGLDLFRCHLGLLDIGKPLSRFEIVKAIGIIAF